MEMEMILHRKIGYYLNFNLHKIISSRAFSIHTQAQVECVYVFVLVVATAVATAVAVHDGYLINSELLPKVPCNNKHYKLFRLIFTYGNDVTFQSVGKSRGIWGFSTSR